MSAERSRPRPRTAVARELARALTDGARLPFAAARYVSRRDEAELLARRDLADVRAPDEAPDPGPLPSRPLRVFVSCAEASGELHARGLVRELRAACAAAGAPPPEVFGLGGARLAEDGVELVGDPVARAAMGVSGVAGSIGFYLRLLTGAARALRDRRPDVVVPVDSPALHVPLGRIARRAGLPVVHFVTPQYWGWAPWRVGGYREAVDTALTILPFEPAWFERHGVRAAHVGHPLLDALVDVPPAEGAGAPDPRDLPPRIAVLPGSREGVVRKNLPFLLAAAARLRAERPDLELVLPHDRPELAPLLEEGLRSAGVTGWARVATGDLHGALREVRAALSVSGTVLLDLLHHRLPAVVVYRLSSSRGTWARERFLTVPHFASVNLLAGWEVYPEFCFHGDGPLEEVARVLRHAYDNPDWRQRTAGGLDEAARRLGPPGATARAAAHALAAAAGGSP